MFFYLSLVCGGEVTGNNHGMINSPGYPGNYPNNRNCVWRISVDPGNNIVFAFAFLNLESHVNCSHDYLQVWQYFQSKKYL